MPKVMWQGKKVDAISTSFKTNREDWNEYRLEDGTYLKLKCVVSEILRIPEIYDQEGNPTYLVKSINVTNVEATDNLKKR